MRHAIPPSSKADTGMMRTLFPGTAQPLRSLQPLTAARPSSLLGLAILSYLLGVIMVITLLPFRFHWPAHVRIYWTTDWLDIVANICLFMPVGFVYRLFWRTQPGQARLRVLLGGTILSTAIELLQLCLPGRYSCPMDVLANGFGAWLGAALHDASARYLQQRLVGQLALELPLMTLFYLFLPLLWLSRLAMGNDPARLWLTLLLGLCGGSILAAMWVHRLRPAGVLSAPGLVLTIAVWFAGGAFPSFASRPGLLAVCSLGVGLTAWLLTVLTCQRARQERRFELPTLRRIGLCYAVYVILIALWPWPWTPQSWHASLGWAEMADDPEVLLILRLLEYLGAFTLLGYMVAEARGRQATSSWHTWLWLCLTSLASAGVLESLRGFHPQHTASLIQVLLLTGAGLYGGLIYTLQLATVQALLEPQQTSQVDSATPAPNAYNRAWAV